MNRVTFQLFLDVDAPHTAFLKPFASMNHHLTSLLISQIYLCCLMRCHSFENIIGVILHDLLNVLNDANFIRNDDVGVAPYITMDVNIASIAQLATLSVSPRNGGKQVY